MEIKYDKLVSEISELRCLQDCIDRFKDEADCLLLLEDVLHSDGILCPRCGTGNPYRYKDGINFKCSGCLKMFTLKVGTIFESSKVPLRKWFPFIFLMKKQSGYINKLQAQSLFNITRRSVLFMYKRVLPILQV